GACGAADVAGRPSPPHPPPERPPAGLGAGQQQGAGTGPPVITTPELTVLDEPTSALDPTARAEIIDLLIRLQRELETAYLFISHDLSTVRYLSHRVAVMYLGMIVEAGPAKDIFSHPRHPYGVGLLSSVLLRNPRRKGEVLVDLKGEIPSPINLPKGCYLAGRCPFADARCTVERPPASIVEPGHLVHCFHYERLADIGRSVDYFAQFQAESE